MPSHRPAVRALASVAAAIALALVAPPSARAQRPADAPPAMADSGAARVAPSAAPSATPSPDAPESRPASRFVVHGYLAQGAAASRGGLAAGIPSEGTLDYRRAALLARVSPTAHDRLVVQAAHRRVGSSPTAAFQDAVELDWLFYERAFGDATQLRVGRIPIPMGIYNETRYVGPILPFFQPPASVYRSRSFSNEVVDGVAVLHELFPASRLPVEVAVYAGGNEFVESSTMPVPPSAAQPAGGWAYQTARGRARRLVGTHLWVTTPVTGLRVGGGALRTTLTEGLRPEGYRDGLTAFSASLDGSFERTTVRAELLGANLGIGRVRSGYVQVGRRVGERLTLNAQSEYGYGLLFRMPQPPTFRRVRLVLPVERDHAVGATWALPGSAVLLKLEGHWTRGLQAEEAQSPFGAARRGRYAIASLAVAF